MKPFLLFIVLVSFGILNAQDRFTFTPQYPKPGEEISITYTPGGNLEGLAKIPEAYVMASSTGGSNITNIKLVKTSGKLLGKFVTDTATRFVAFGFTNDGKYDTNNDNGFIILLNNGNKPCEKANVYACNFYNTLGKSRFGILRNKERALQYLEEEMKLYPKSKKELYLKYVTLQYQTSPTTGKAIVQNEIENTAASLYQKEDYSNLAGLYKLLEFENQSKFITRIRDEKFPATMLSQTDILLQNATKMTDFRQQEAALDRLLPELQKTGNASKYEGSLNSIRQSIARAYLGQRDDAGFKK